MSEENSSLSVSVVTADGESNSVSSTNSRYIYVCLNFKEVLLSLFNLLQSTLFGEPARQDFQEVHGSTQATQPKSRACGNCGELDITRLSAKMRKECL